MSQEPSFPAGLPPLSNRRGHATLTEQFKEHFKPVDNTYKKRIRVILNPAAGQDEPALKIFNRSFREAGFDWDVRITQQEGDGTRLAREAVSEGIDIVAVYGGDGSVMEAASGLLGTPVPLAILPGGTGNVISIELGIPREIEPACAAVVAENRNVQKIDVGMIDEQPFLLRTGVGLEAAVTRAADREAKDKYGIFAYVISTLQALAEPDMVHYNIRIDGEEIVSEGLSCVVANSGSLGVAGLALSPDVSVTDGLLDVFVIRKADLVSLFSLASSILGKSSNNEAMPHWKGKLIEINADREQEVHADGEMIGRSPVTVKVLPGALNVILPPPVAGSPGAHTQETNADKV